jgi:mRNA-degrading endonuclease RelE of RelBE toxin-antitoxin system
MYNQESQQRGRKKEREYYKAIKDKLSDLLRDKFSDFHLEITADKRFSNKLKGEISQYREIIFSFLKEAAPDIAGFIKKQYATDFIVVEVKLDRIKLDDIYQTRKYAELFDARYALLIAKGEIPDEIKRLSRVVYSLLALPAYKTLTIIHYEEKTEQFIEWFPRNPFEEDR